MRSCADWRGATSDASVRTTVRRQLEHLGYTILEATNGRDALRLCAEAPERVALLLTDVVMPEMGAAELVAHLRDRVPALPVLLMSGYGEADVRAPGLQTAGLVRIQKPIEPDTLALRVREALDARRSASAS